MVLLLLNASVLYGVKFYLYSQGGKQLEDFNNVIQNKLSAQNGSSALTDRTLIAEVPTKENIHFRIITENGKILNSSDKFNYKLRTKETINGKIVPVENRDKHLLLKNVTIDTTEYGTTYIQVVKDMENEYDFMRILMIFMAAADLIGMIVSIFLGYVVSKRMLKPIDYITEAAENISINNLKERIEVKGPEDELKRLGNTFNRMINRLQDAFNRQVQFISDASHELRTPIAVIQGYASLLDRWGKDDREALEKSIYAIQLEADNMAKLTEKLLFLAKGDSGTHALEKEEFQLEELVQEVVEESRLIAQDKIITNEKNQAVRVFADYKIIKQMLRIFIENSIKFTGEKGCIDISSELEGEYVKMSVIDNGIGIPKDEIKNIFYRFYTVDKSRSKDTGGTGLGLSIAEWIVNMHQGQIQVESREGEGTTIAVRFKLKS